MLAVAPELVGTASPAFEPITRANDPFLLPDMGASGVLGDPAAASAAAGEQFVATASRALAERARRPGQPRHRGEPTMTEFRAGAASLPLEPPLGLPMVGFIRQPWNARGYGLPLEVGALVLERGDTRVVLCGVDVVGIIHPQIEPLLDRVAAATGAAPRRGSS